MHGRHFRGAGEGGQGQVGVICGQGGEIHTNSFAMIMFCVFVGAVYMHLAHCRLFMG